MTNRCRRWCCLGHCDLETSTSKASLDDILYALSGSYGIFYCSELLVKTMENRLHSVISTTDNA